MPSRLAPKCGQANVDPHIAAIGPTQLRKPARQPGRVGLRLRIGFIELDEHTDPPHWFSLLRAGGERQCGHRATKRDNESSPSDMDCHVTPPMGGRADAIEER